MSSSIFAPSKGSSLPGASVKILAERLIPFNEAETAATNGQPAEAVALYTKFLLTTPNELQLEINKYKETAVMKAAQLIKASQ